MGQDNGEDSDPRGWYVLGVILSIMAMFSIALAIFQPTLGYPLGFMFTMLGLISMSQPSWLSNPDGRLRLLAVNLGVFVTQAVFMYLSLYQATI